MDLHCHSCGKLLNENNATVTCAGCECDEDDEWGRLEGLLAEARLTAFKLADLAMREAIRRHNCEMDREIAKRVFEAMGFDDVQFPFVDVSR